jgi:hypothetical protein
VLRPLRLIAVAREKSLVVELIFQSPAFHTWLHDSYRSTPNPITGENFNNNGCFSRPKVSCDCQTSAAARVALQVMGLSANGSDALAEINCKRPSLLSTATPLTRRATQMEV